MSNKEMSSMKKVLIHSLMVLFLLPLCALDQSKILADKGYYPVDTTGVSPSEIDDESDDDSDDNNDDNCKQTLLKKSCSDPKGIYPDDSGQ